MPSLDPEDGNERNDKPSQNIIAHISKFADDNLSFVRNISTCLGLAGLIIIARSIRLERKLLEASVLERAQEGSQQPKKQNKSKWSCIFT